MMALKERTTTRRSSKERKETREREREREVRNANEGRRAKWKKERIGRTEGQSWVHSRVARG